MPYRPNELLARYVALWNETDADRRRERVRELYAPDCTYVFYRKDPVRGHQALLEQLAYTHEVYGPMGYEFRSANNATGHHDVVRFNWVMVSGATGEMEMSGQDIVVLAEDGRIQADYQFHDRMPASFAYNDGYEEHGVAVRPARPTPTGVPAP
ncbi:nuclear transport factor 2 family protein [Streptomyces sp. NPDC087917]|uniref:nuclear transport factor 2 family protein n=1 Tax=unclassified Streptomyces TaxID=2593676 RepID=UPI00341B7B90